MIEHLEENDEFVYFSKYGGTTFGIVKEIFPENCLGATCNYIVLKIKSNSGIVYDYNECFKLTKKLSPDEIKKRHELSEKIKNYKGPKTIPDHIPPLPTIPDSK